jgi:DNA polymerase-1
MRRESLDLSRLHEWPIVAPDVETTGLNHHVDKMFGVSITGCDPVAGVWATQYFDIRDTPHIKKTLARALPKCKKIINHNIKFDMHFLGDEGIYLPDHAVECTSVRAALINEHEHSFSLDNLGFKYCGVKKEDIWHEMATLFGGSSTKEAQIKNLHRAPASLVGKYARVDTENAILLWLYQEKQIEEQDLHQVWDLERKLTPILYHIERQGVRVDVARTKATSMQIDSIVGDAQKKLDKLAKGAVNANSPKQMRELFGVVSTQLDNGQLQWKTDEGVVLETTDAGAASLAKEALIRLAEFGDKRAEQILILRRMIKAKQFCDNHILEHEYDGYVYPNYNQTRGENELGTGTGRFSISDPALQQIPARDKDVAALVRSCFIPEKGSKWGCADWKQFEFRWFAHYTKDEKIAAIYKADPDADFHKLVSDITGIPRNAPRAGGANAKQINLGMVFGMGGGKLASQMNLPFTERWDERNKRTWLIAGQETEEVMATYHSAIPGVKQMLTKANNIAKSRGYVKTVMGRHIRFPGGEFTYKAAGLVFQGSSADSMKQKMIELWPLFQSEPNWRMLLSVHDEIDSSVPDADVPRANKEMKQILETFDGEKCPIKCDIPILSDVTFAENWFEASK